MGKSRNFNYAIMVNVTEDEAVALQDRVPESASTVHAMATLATEYLRGLAAGGAFLPPEWAQRARAAIGSVDPAAVISAVERSVRRDGEATRVEWIVDPTQIQFYRGLADNAGVSLEHELKTLLDYAYEQGWFGWAAPDVFKLLLTAPQYRYLQQVFEKDIVTGDDVMQRLHQLVGTPAIVREEDDPIMESLTGM